MALPDYDHSIVNLMASVALGLGDQTVAYAPLPELPPALFHDRPVVLLLIDGLGRRLLDRHRQTRLYRHLRSTLTSVFPTTTASAVTTFATASAPQQHAVTGWFMWLKELGSLATILPFRPRHGGIAYAGITPRQLIGRSPLSERLRVRSACVNPEHIAHSEFSRFAAGTAMRFAHRGLDSMFDQIGTLVAEWPGYVFAYWSELDSLAHRFGASSAEVSRHLLEIDAAFARFVDGLKGSGTLVLATADHGLVDASADRTIHLEAHPALAATLAMPLCGEPRAAYCYVRPGRVAQFKAYVEGELGHGCELFESRRLMEEGWFGRGQPDPRLQDRIGDFLILMREGWVIHDRLPTEGEFTQAGVHGGLSADELDVPLIAIEC